MKNELLHIGPLTVYGYGFMIAMGVLAAWFVTEQRARRLHLAYEHIFYLVVWCAIGGFASAKILFWITNWKEFLQNPQEIIGSEGFVVYGGIIGGILVGWLYCTIKKLKCLTYFDLMMPSIALAQGFGRIGCLLAGCCYGKETTGSLAITFTDSAFAPNHVPLIPTQIYSSILDFAHFFLLLYVAKHKKADGQVAGCYLICYSIGRFVIEMFRGDIERGNVGIFSTSQFISIFILIIGIGLTVAAGRKKFKSNP